MAEPTELVARLDGIDRKLDRLSTSVDERFARVDEQFARVDLRFARVDERFDRVDKRFEAVLAEIAAEGEKTRRHFDIVAEQMKSERNLAIDMAAATSEHLVRLTAANAADHVSFDSRLTNLERRQP